MFWVVKYARLVLIGSLFASSSTLAQTVDGVTPVDEAICDGLKGATPGLYGLCVAYCEAQDIAEPSIPLTEEEIQSLASKAPSRSILESYDARREDGDPPMPCVVAQGLGDCPCFNSELLNLYDAGQIGDSTDCQLRNPGVLPLGSYLNATQTTYNTKGQFGTSLWPDGQFASTCYAVGNMIDDAGNAWILPGLQPVSVEEHASCDSLLRSRIQELQSQGTLVPNCQVFGQD